MDNNHNNRNDDHKKIQKLALEFLKDHKTAVVATASRGGEPQAATVFYAIDDDFTFNFITDKISRKFKNLKENPHVAVVVGTGEDVRTVQCGGHVETVDYLKDTDRAEGIIRKVIENIKLHSDPPAWPVLINPSVEFGIFILKPSWMVFLNLEIQKNGDTTPYDYLKVLP